MGLVNEHPLADWSQLDHFRLADPDDPANFTGMERKIVNPDNKYLMTSIFMLLFERLHTLHGYESTLDGILFLEQERVERLADRIVDFNLAIIDNIASRFPGLSTVSTSPTTGAPSGTASSAIGSGRVLQAALQETV